MTIIRLPDEHIREKNRRSMHPILGNFHLPVDITDAPRPSGTQNLSRAGWDEDKCRMVLTRVLSWIPRNLNYADGLRILHPELQLFFGDENIDLAFGILEELIECDFPFPFPDSAYQRWKHGHSLRMENLSLPHVPHTSTIVSPVLPSERLIAFRIAEATRKGLPHPFIPRANSTSQSLSNYSGGSPSVIAHQPSWKIDYSVYVSFGRKPPTVWTSPKAREFHTNLWDKSFGSGGIKVSTRELIVDPVTNKLVPRVNEGLMPDNKPSIEEDLTPGGKPKELSPVKISSLSSKRARWGRLLVHTKSVASLKRTALANLKSKKSCLGDMGKNVRSSSIASHTNPGDGARSLASRASVLSNISNPSNLSLLLDDRDLANIPDVPLPADTAVPNANFARKYGLLIPDEIMPDSLLDPKNLRLTLDQANSKLCEEQCKKSLADLENQCQDVEVDEYQLRELQLESVKRVLEKITLTPSPGLFFDGGLDFTWNKPPRLSEPYSTASSAGSVRSPSVYSSIFHVARQSLRHSFSFPYDADGEESRGESGEEEERTGDVDPQALLQVEPAVSGFRRRRRRPRRPTGVLGPFGLLSSSKKSKSLCSSLSVEEDIVSARSSVSDRSMAEPLACPSPEPVEEEVDRDDGYWMKEIPHCKVGTLIFRDNNPQSPVSVTGAARKSQSRVGGPGGGHANQEETNDSLMQLPATVYTPSTASTAVEVHFNAQITDDRDPSLLILPNLVYTGNAGRELAEQRAAYKRAKGKEVAKGTANYNMDGSSDDRDREGDNNNIGFSFDSSYSSIKNTQTNISHNHNHNHNHNSKKHRLSPLSQLHWHGDNSNDIHPPRLKKQCVKYISIYISTTATASMDRNSRRYPQHPMPDPYDPYQGEPLHLRAKNQSTAPPFASGPAYPRCTSSMTRAQLNSANIATSASSKYRPAARGRRVHFSSDTPPRHHYPDAPASTPSTVSEIEQSYMMDEGVSAILGNFINIDHPPNSGFRRMAAPPSSFTQRNAGKHPYEFEPETPQNNQRDTTFTDFMTQANSAMSGRPSHTKNSRSMGNALHISSPPLAMDSDNAPSGSKHRLHRSHSSPVAPPNPRFQSVNFENDSDDDDYQTIDVHFQPNIPPNRPTDEEIRAIRDRTANKNQTSTGPHSQRQYHQPGSSRGEQNNYVNESSFSHTYDHPRVRSPASKESSFSHTSNLPRRRHRSPVRNEPRMGPERPSNSGGSHAYSDTRTLVDPIPEQDETEYRQSARAPARASSPHRRTRSPMKKMFGKGGWLSNSPIAGEYEPSTCATSPPRKRNRSPMKKLFSRKGWLGESPNEMLNPRMKSLKEAAARDDANRPKKIGMLGKIRNMIGELAERADLTALVYDHGKSIKGKLLPISVGRFEQATVILEVELMLHHNANRFLATEFSEHRVTIDSVKKIDEIWKSKGQPEIMEFMYPLDLQRQLVALNLPRLRFFGPRAGDDLKVMGMLNIWESVAKALTRKTFCSPDSVLKKLLFDIEGILELLGTGADMLYRFQMIRQYLHNFIEVELAKKAAQPDLGITKEWLPTKAQDALLGGDPYGGLKLVPDSHVTRAQPPDGDAAGGGNLVSNQRTMPEGAEFGGLYINPTQSITSEDTGINRASNQISMSGGAVYNGGTPISHQNNTSRGGASAGFYLNPNQNIMSGEAAYSSVNSVPTQNNRSGGATYGDMNLSSDLYSDEDDI